MSIRNVNLIVPQLFNDKSDKFCCCRPNIVIYMTSTKTLKINFKQKLTYLDLSLAQYTMCKKQTNTQRFRDGQRLKIKINYSISSILLKGSYISMNPKRCIIYYTNVHLYNLFMRHLRQT
jgi:hypothetical protein